MRVAIAVELYEVVDRSPSPEFYLAGVNDHGPGN